MSLPQLFYKCKSLHSGIEVVLGGKHNLNTEFHIKKRKLNKKRIKFNLGLKFFKCYKTEYNCEASKTLVQWGVQKCQIYCFVLLVKSSLEMEAKAARGEKWQCNKLLLLSCDVSLSCDNKENYHDCFVYNSISKIYIYIYYIRK